LLFNSKEKDISACTVQHLNEAIAAIVEMIIEANWLRCLELGYSENIGGFMKYFFGVKI
jgi:DNA-binding MurR/RpiR family transcriptional regulator